MEQFLTLTSAKLKSNNYAKLTAVLGNESCDLDSAISAIVYASFLYWQHEQIKNGTCTRTHRDESTYTDDIFVPILNVDREDFALKTEVTFCLKSHNIDESKLIFRNDVDLKTLEKNFSVILVDHHVLAKSDSYLSPYVTEVIDHRPCDPAAQLPPAVRRTLEVVGSCASLVLERLREMSSTLAADEDYFAVYRDAVVMMHAVIILDTVNFSKQVQKGTPKDEEGVQFLETYIRADDVQVYRVTQLSRLSAARSDVSALTASQLLRKDAKMAGDVLVPSLPILVEEFLQRADVRPALAGALSRCRAAVLLGSARRGAGMTRDLAVCGERTEMLINVLLNSTSPPLQLTLCSTNIENCTYFKQGNVAASRKQYMPIINEYLKINTK